MIQKIGCVDTTKGLAMLFVIWGHVSHGSLSNFFFVFHMPLFFIISGFLYNADKYKSISFFAANRYRRLLIPYFIYSFATWAIWAGYRYFTFNDTSYLTRSLLQTFWAQGSAGYLMHNAPLWFITCLFVVEMVYYFLSRCFTAKANIGITLCISLLAMYSVKLNIVPHLRELPWNFEVGLAALFFYAFGQYVRYESINRGRFVSLVKSGKVSNVKVTLIGVCSLILCILLYSQIGGADMGGDYYTTIPFLFIPAALMGTVFTVSLCFVISKIAFLNIITRFLRWVGENTLDILMIHVPIKGILIVFLAKYLNVTLQGDAYFYETKYAVIAFVATIGIVVPIVYVINQLRVMICSKYRFSLVQKDKSK